MRNILLPAAAVAASAAALYGATRISHDRKALSGYRQFSGTITNVDSDPEGSGLTEVTIQTRHGTEKGWSTLPPYMIELQYGYNQFVTIPLMTSKYDKP